MGKYVNPHAGAKRIEQKKKKYINPHSGAERNRGGVVEGTAYLAGNLGLGVAGVAEGLTDIAAAGPHLMRGDLYMAKQPFIDSKTAEAQQDLKEWYNPGKGMQFAGDVVSGAGQSVSYGLLSAIPIIGKPLMFASIGSQGVSSAAGRTGDVGLKELGYGATVGAVEGILESKLGAGVNAVKSLGSAALKRTGVNVAKSAAKVGGKSMIASVLVDTAKGAAGEFAEEAISEAVDPALLRLFNIDENAQFNLGNVLYAGVVGALSGGLMTAGPAAINFESARKTGQSIREAGEVEQTLHTAEMLIKGAERAQTTAKESKATEKPGKDASVGQKITATAKSAASGIKSGQEASKARQMADKLQKNVAAYRQIMADPAKATSSAADALLGELRGNMYLAQVAYQIETYEAILANAEPEQKQQIVDVINDEAAKLGAKRSDYTVADLDANTDDIVTKLAAEMSLSSLARVFDTAEATEKPAEATTSPWDGMADSEDMSGYKATGEAENALLKAAVKESVPRGSVQAMLDEFRKGTDMTPEEFAAAWSDGVHIYGRYGFDVGEESPLSRMSPEAREAAMKFGRETEEAERKAAEEKSKAKKKPAEMAGKKGTVVRGKGLEIKTLSDEQYAAYKAAEVLAEVLGTEIVIETAITDKKGRTVNGYYDTKTNRLHVNINVLRDGKNISLYTLGHEVTHYIKEWSPTKFEALADFVLDQMGVDAETAVADKLASLKRLGIVTDTMTVAEANALAREELVAEGMELVLTDGKVLEELAHTDRSIWQKVKAWIQNIISKIRKHYGELNQASKTAQVLKETVESLEEIERLFTEGVTEAGERTRTAEAGVIVDDASGTAMLSVDDIPKTEQEIDDAVNRLVQKLGVDESRARKWVEDEISLATLILRDDMVDYTHRKADRRLTAIVKNSDYKQGTLDFSNICRKRREYTRMMQRIQQAFPNRRFTAEEFATIRKIMVDEGLEVAYGLCYVEDRRQQEGYIAETFRKAVETWRAGNHKTFWDSFNKKWTDYNARQIKAMNMLAKGDYVPTIADLTTVEGMEELGKDVEKGGHPDILRAWRTFNNARGQGAARLLTNEAEYQRQILKYSKDRVKRINDLGGLRVFSFSDFEEFHLLDIIQAVQDCAAMGIKIQFYTKVPSFALLMADTKAKGNLSLIPKGDLGYEMKNGKRVLVYDPVEGIDFNDPAFKEVARGNPNIGTILVGINDEHIRTAMEDDFIDYIIPFHTGQTEVVRQIKKIGKWQNYKNEQVDKPWESGSKAKPVNVYTDVIAAAEREGDPIRNERQFVERFLKACEERGLRPRFSRFLNTNAEGKYVYTKGYYKLLLDFKMFDKDGTYLPQEPVIPEFDADLLHELTEKYVAGEKAKTEAESPAFKRALERVEAEVVGDDEGRMYSIDETPETPDVSENRDLTDREILGMALEGAVQNEDEWKIVKSYREQAALLELVREKRDGYIKEANALERQIKALRARMEDEGDPDGWIRKAMDDAIAKKREAERMRDEQVKILDNADRELLRMKAAKPFREILAREQKRVRAAEYKAERAEEKAEKARETTKRVREEYKEKIYKARRDATDYKRAVYRTAYEKAEEKNRAYRERTDRKADESRERKEMTARKRTIMRVLGGLQTKLVNPTKTNHAPKELHDLVQTVMRTADPKAWDANRKNIREMGDLAADIEKLERQATRTAKEQERLDAMKSKYEILEQQTMPLAKQAQAMYAAYKKYNDTLPEDMKIPESVMTEMSEMVDKIEDVPLKEMGLESLKAVETFVKALSTQINNANELFVRKRGEQVSDWGNAASREAAESKPLKWLSPKSMEIKNARDVRDFLWKNMKPLTAFEAIGSPKLMELFQSVLDGEEVWITDVLEAREAIVKAKEKYGYDTWDLKTRREFTNGEGKTVKLTVGEMMSLYAYAKREQAMGHLRGGGFVLDAGATEITEKSKIRTEKMLNLTERYTMTEEDMGKLAGMLTEEQKQYATEIQDYLTSLGEKGNEISRKLYGLDLFNEEHYFPIKVKSEYLESQTGKTGDPKIKNRGMSKETVPDAQNPLVLQDFMTIVSGHVNDMATYHAFVLPVEDLTRVLNYQPSNAIIDEDGNWTEDKERKEYSTLKAVIESKYGAQANTYIEQLIRDLNGGARREAAANLIDKGITAFKRASTMASLSVLVQQPTSVFRAMAYVDPKHFRSLAALDIKGHKEAWEQVKKYAKVAAIKEMGGYDTGVGTRTADYLNSKDYKTWGERAKAFFLPDVYGGDSNYRAEIFGKGAAYADELAWIQMFDACKREQAEKLGKPMDSEEVLEAAGKRFTEVVRRTQVYDSTLTRSEYMRSKDTGMKMATAFMAEPTTVVSMMLDGLIRANRGDKAFLKKTAGAIAASVIFNALAVSLIYAARDDDEEKTYTEKYLATLATETAEGFNPLEYLPYTRDVMSLMKGYDIERTDMALFADLFKSFERITSSTRTPVEKTTEVAGAVASFFGVPIRNLVRDAMIPVNLVQSAASGERTTGKGISAAIADEFSIITNLFGVDTTNAHELYKAAKSGDQAHYDRVASRYKSEQAAEMALRTALRENDKRIAEAAEAKISGELEAYESIVEQIESEGRFDRDLIIRAINNEVLDIKDNADQVVIPEEEATDEEDEPTEPLYGTSDLNAALTRGDREDFEDIYYYLLATKQEQGKTEAQAKAAVKSGITSYWKKQYLAAWETNNTAEMKRILELLEETELYGGYNDVATMAQKWIQES